MPCSICRFPGHNCSTCIWKNVYKSNMDLQKYIFTEEFYISSIKELLVHIYTCDEQLNNIQDHILSIKDRIENYSTFNKTKYRVKNKKDDCNCVICMDECIDTKLCYQCNTCNVVFHQQCIDSWFSDNKKTCPACRADWGEKTDAPRYLTNAYNKYINLFESKVDGFKQLESFMIDTLTRYYYNIPSKNINTDIITYIPNYMIIKSQEQHAIALKFDIIGRPSMSNGYRNLINF